MRIGLCLVAIAGAAQAAPRPGHAVRIERHRRAIAQSLRLCGFDRSGTTCVGPKPAIGDEIEVVDSRHYLGSVRIMSIDAPPPACEEPGLWRVQIDDEQLERTAEKASDHNGMGVFGIVGLELDPARARAVAPSTVSGEDALSTFGIDADGDGRADVAFKLAPCPDQAKHGQAFCIEVFTRSGDRDLALSRRDLIDANCIKSP